MKVGAVYTITKGKKPGELSESKADGYIRFIQIEDLRGDTKLKHCPPSRGHVNCEVDDLLIVWDGAYSGLVSHGLQGAFGSTLARLRPITNKAFTPYVCRYLKSQLGEIQRNRTGATIPHVNGAHLRDLEIPLPPLIEQKRIAGILDAADVLRAKRNESLAQLDSLLQSTFIDMFGDPVTNPMKWDVAPLENLGSLERGISKHRPRNAPFLLGGPHPLIQTGDVSGSEGYIRSYASTYSDLGLRQSRKWPAGTLCITIAANIANTGILTFDACFPDSVVGFSSEEKGRVEYVQGLFWFLREILERRAPQVAQKNINLKILRRLPVPVPSAHLQHRFAAIVESIERQKAVMRAHLAELDNLFASLQSRAFSGAL